MNAYRERQLRTAQRSMLRKILQVSRRPVTEVGTSSDSDSESSDKNSVQEGEESTAAAESELEPWVDWIRRATHVSEDWASRFGVQDWVTEQ
eukprot:3280182-Karenia_brevis.AAC.1